MFSENYTFSKSHQNPFRNNMLKRVYEKWLKNRLGKIQRGYVCNYIWVSSCLTKMSIIKIKSNLIMQRITKGKKNLYTSRTIKKIDFRLMTAASKDFSGWGIGQSGARCGGRKFRCG